MDERLLHFSTTGASSVFYLPFSQFRPFLSLPLSSHLNASVGTKWELSLLISFTSVSCLFPNYDGGVRALQGLLLSGRKL